MIATLDDRHIARGYDPYNSADQPWVMQLVNIKRRVARCDLTDKEFAHNPNQMGKARMDAFRNAWRSDAVIDEQMRKGFQHLARNGYEFFPPQKS